MGKFKIDREKKTVVYFHDSADRHFVGIAKCSPNDKFDEEVGKKLAKLRVELAVRKADLQDLIATKNLNDIDIQYSTGRVRKMHCTFEKILLTERDKQVNLIRGTKRKIQELLNN